jgi:hypothetical protein
MSNIQAPILQNTMKIFQIIVQEKINALKKYFKNH